MISRCVAVFLLAIAFSPLGGATPKPPASSLPGTAAYHRARFEPGQTVNLNVSHVQTLLIDGHYCLILYTFDSRADVDGGTALAFVSPEQERAYSVKYGTRRIRRRAASGGRDLGVTTRTLPAILERKTADALYVRLL